MDERFRRVLAEVCSTDQPAGLVTIIGVKGSTPRKPGAKMLVLPDGQVFGTIGGGCGESEVIRETRGALDSLQSSRYTVNMTNSTAEEEGMLCGGTMEVFIQILGPGSTPEKQTLAAYLKSLSKGENPILATVVHGPVPGAVGKFLFFFNSKSIGDLGSAEFNKLVGDSLQQFRDLPKQVKPQLQVLVHEGGIAGESRWEIFIEPAPTILHLVILGGGHIALPLANMAKLLNYRVTVVDDRPFFANTARFPTAEKVICGSFNDALDSLEITPATYVVIVTRGHRHDKACLGQVVTKPAGYIGMIGSRRRVKALLAELTESGVDPKLLGRIYSPIGLNIGAETPEEIAVSILGEIIGVHRGATTPACSNH